MCYCPTTANTSVPVCDVSSLSSQVSLWGIWSHSEKTSSYKGLKDKMGPVVEKKRKREGDRKHLFLIFNVWSWVQTSSAIDVLRHKHSQGRLVVSLSHLLLLNNSKVDPMISQSNIGPLPQFKNGRKCLSLQDPILSVPLASILIWEF